MSENAKRATQGRAEVPGTLISDYLVGEAESGSPAELIVLLHGYQQSGKVIFDKLASLCPPGAKVLAPNGPYPIPDRRPDGSYRMGFSWYFYDPGTDEYFIDMRVSLDFIVALIQSLGLEGLPKRVIGFSQGGYLAPFVAQRLSGVRQVIGIASAYLPDELQSSGVWPLPFRADAVHGEEDEVVSCQSSMKSHTQLMQAGTGGGSFAAIAGATHRMSSTVQEAVRMALELSRLASSQ